MDGGRKSSISGTLLTETRLRLLAIVRQQRMLKAALQRNVRTLCHDDGLCDTVLHTAAIGMDEVLEEAETTFKRGGSVAQCTLNRMPQGEVTMHKRDHANFHEALAG